MNNRTKNANARPETATPKGNTAKDTGLRGHAAKGQQQNEGEGNRTAAREFNADQQRLAGDKQKVDQAAQAAKKAVDGPEGKDLAQAEKAGAKHAKG
jgi:hypothetical protein